MRIMETTVQFFRSAKRLIKRGSKAVPQPAEIEIDFPEGAYRLIPPRPIGFEDGEAQMIGNLEIRWPRPIFPNQER